MSESLASPVRVGKRLIGPGEPCFVIAEAGSNHNGDLDLARRLIEIAADAGADAVKFQVFRARSMYPTNAGVSDYLKLATPIYDIISDMEMSYDWLPRLSEWAQQRGIELLASVFDNEAVDRLDAYVPAFKIASYEMNHIPLLQHASRKQKPLIISSGAATLEEIGETIDACRGEGNAELVLLQCTAAYPAPLDALNIRAMATIRDRFDVPVGLSDHSRDPLVGPLTAVAAGASVIEKHYTVSNDLPGPDHRFAVEPADLTLMVRKIREAEAALGRREKVVDPVEQELRAFARRSIFAVRNIAAGEAFTEDNVAVLRCGKNTPGLPPREYGRLIGRAATRALRAESSIQPSDVV